MKVQIASDLHLEFLQHLFPGERLITPAVDADMLLLAGDIGNGTLAMELFKNWPVPVLYLAGKARVLRRRYGPGPCRVTPGCSRNTCQFS
jgi:hypothetical protein